MIAEPMHRLSIQLLGGFAVQDERGFTYLANSHRLQSLLAYLLLHQDRPLSRDQIAFTFWPDSTETKARTSLRSLLYHLRKELPDVGRFLDVAEQTVQWRLDAFCALDVAEFEQALAQATTAGDLQAALDRYSGDLLPDCYEDWIIAERERLRQRYLNGLAQLVALHEQQDNYAAAIAAARALLQAEPLREESYWRLMRLHALQRELSPKPCAEPNNWLPMGRRLRTSVVWPGSL